MIEALIFLVSAGVFFIVPAVIFRYRTRKINKLTKLIVEQKNTIIKQVDSILESQKEYDSFISHHSA